VTRHVAAKALEVFPTLTFEVDRNDARNHHAERLRRYHRAFTLDHALLAQTLESPLHRRGRQADGIADGLGRQLRIALVALEDGQVETVEGHGACLTSACRKYTEA